MMKILYSKPKFIGIGVFLLAIVIGTFPLLPNVRSASFVQPIGIDGVNDWDSDSLIIQDTLSDSNANPDLEIGDVYANFTEDYLYLGFQMNTTFDGDTFIALDYDTSSAHEIGTLVWNKRVKFWPGQGPELIIVLDDEAVQAYTNYGGVSENASVESRLTGYAGSGTATFREVKISRQDLLYSDWVNISIIFTATEDGKAALDVAPDDPGVNSTGDVWNDWDYISTYYYLNMSGTAPWDERFMNLDGNLNDYKDDEKVYDDLLGDTSNDGGDIVNVSVAWNASHIFFGIYGPILSPDTSAKQHTLFIGLDTGDDGGVYNPWDRNVSYSGGDNRPNYIIALGYVQAGDGPWSQLFNQSGGYFSYVKNISQSYLGYEENPFTEVAIPLSDIGNPASLNFTIVVTKDTKYTSAIDVFPNSVGMQLWYYDNDTVSNYMSTRSDPDNFVDISIDGNSSDWPAYTLVGSEWGDTIEENSDLDDLMLTWDQDYIYFGINGSDPRSSVSRKVDMFVAIDDRPGGGTVGFWAKKIVFGGGFMPDYIIAIEDENSHQILQWNGSDWQDVSAQISGFSLYVGFNTEIRFPKENIGGNAFNYSVFVTPDTDNTGIIDVMPNCETVNPDFTVEDNVTTWLRATDIDKRYISPNKPPAAPVLQAPAPAVDKDGKIQLDWNDVDNAGGYIVYRYYSPITSLNGTCEVLAYTTQSAYNDTISRNGTYYYAVVAYNATGYSGPSNSEGVEVAIEHYPPEAPTWITTDKTINTKNTTVEWKAVSGATSYNVYVNGTLNGTTSDTSMNVWLWVNGTYHLIVTAVNASGESANSTVLIITVAIPEHAPPAPVLITTSQTIADDNITIEWNAVSGATSYNIYVNGTLNGTSTGTSYNILNLKEATYEIYVTAVNSSGESAPSASITVIVQFPEYPPNAPILITGDMIVHVNNATIEWGAVAGADSYNVYVNNTLNATTDLLSITIQFGGNGVYVITVTAVNSSGESAPSAAITITVDIPPYGGAVPLAPILEEITPNPDNDGNIELHWNAVEYADYYEIYRSTSPITDISSLEPVATVTNTSYTDRDLEDGTYYYVVVAVNENGRSEPSNVRSVTVHTEQNAVQFNSLELAAIIGGAAIGSILIIRVISGMRSKSITPEDVKK